VVDAGKAGAMESRERELARLIEEQKRDDTSVQMPEPRTEGYGILLDILDEDGQLSTTRFAGARREMECAIHGNAETRLDPHKGQGYACRACDRENQRRRRADPEVRAHHAEQQRRYRREAKARGEVSRCGPGCHQPLSRHPWHDD
jgi:hypothetical protein